MPYHVGEKGSYGCAGYPVVKDSDNEVMGCHATKEDAKKQLAALYVNEPEASKEKAMAMDYATSYAEIVKYDKNEDGTLMVYGKATDDTLDLDSQICDPKWLDEAMPRWFKSGGNIREMHGPSAAGIAKEYEAKSDGHYIGVHVVDPLAAKKVETGVYQGFSIGIKSPRVVRDAKAANGRIIDGSIIEVSLVDRPANPSAKLILAKAVEGETSLVQVEELHEYSAPLPSEIAKYNDNHDEHGRFAEGDGGGSSGGSSDHAGRMQDIRDSLVGARDAAFHQDMMNGRETGNSAARQADEANQRIDAAHAALADGKPDQAAAELRGASQALEDERFSTQSSQLDSLANQITNGSERGSALAAHGDAKANAIEEHANATNDQNAREAVGHMREAADHAQAAYDARQAGDHSASNRASSQANISAHRAENALYNSSNPATNALAQNLGQAFGRTDLRGKSATPTQKELKMETIKQITELAKSLTTVDSAKFDKSLFDNARKALAELIASEALEMTEGHDETGSLVSLVNAVHALMTWYEGEATEGEVAPMEEVEEVISDKGADIPTCEDGKCGKCEKCMAANADMEKTTDAEETVVAEEALVVEEAPAVEEISETQEVSDATSIEDVVEKAVKSAMESVKSEIESLRADKEAAVEKSVKLESDLATALSKSVAGGPKRTATKMSDEATNDALVKAASYKAKADATTDPVLAKGYRALYAEFLAKATPKSEN